MCSFQLAKDLLNLLQSKQSSDRSHKTIMHCQLFIVPSCSAPIPIMLLYHYSSQCVCNPNVAWRNKSFVSICSHFYCTIKVWDILFNCQIQMSMIVNK